MFRKIDRILLRVPSVPAAVHYYVNQLQFSIIRQDHRLASLKFAESDAELVLHNDPDLPTEAVYYLVDDVRGMYSKKAELSLTFVSPPAQSSRGWRAMVKDPFGNVLLIVDRSLDQPNVIEDAKPAGSLFAGVIPPVPANRTALIRAYEQIGRTADDLPYTPHFETLHRSYTDAMPDPKPTKAETWRHLLNLRKGGKLPRLGEARSHPPEISAEERELLKVLVGDSIGRRDRLPYTPGFDELVDRFNQTRQRPLSPHLVWRLVATLAK